MFFRFVPHLVIFGFVNGLAIIIFTSQIDQFKDPSGNWLTGTSLYILLALVALTILIIWFLPKITKAFPASLAAIIAVFAVSYIFKIDTHTVSVISSIKGGFTSFLTPMVLLIL